MNCASKRCISLQQLCSSLFLIVSLQTVTIILSVENPWCFVPCFPFECLLFCVALASASLATAVSYSMADEKTENDHRGEVRVFINLIDLFSSKYIGKVIFTVPVFHM